ncbi:MAG: insulinase family protein [Bryobacteraceae bacterium]|nr:insulinase family protein [Bryobacteraceae bacterium]
MLRHLLIFSAVLGLAFGQAAKAPAKAPAKAAAAPSGMAARYKNLVFPPLRDVEIPQVEKFTLSNGMKVYLLENHELPLISGRALVRVGNLFDPAGKAGLADLTGGLIRSGGTKAKTQEQINEALEGIAGSVESSIGETSGNVGFSALAETSDQVMALFAEILTQPAFRQDKIDNAKIRERSGISRRNDDAGGIAGREFSRILYGPNTPYGTQMEYATLDAITRDDMVAFYDRHFFPANMMLSVYGDFKTAEMKERLEKLFGNWKVQRPPVPAMPKVSETAKPGVKYVEKTDVTQAFIRIGHLSGKLNDKDYPALEVMSSILGGGFPSRLVRKVRSEMGAAYSIYSNWGANYDHPGEFSIGGSIESKSTIDALSAIQEEVSKLRNLEVTDQELSTAKSTALNSFVFNFDSPAKTLNRMVAYDYWGYPADFLNQYKKAVEGVTKAEVLRVAKQYVRPENFTIVVVGDAKKFEGKDLKALGMPVEKLDITIPQPKQEKAKSDAGSIAKGRQLIDKAVAYVGGAANLAALKDYVQSVDAKMGNGMSLIQKNSWIAPGQLRQDVTLPFGKISTFFDGQSGWMKAPQGEQVIPGAMVGMIQQQLFAELLSLLRSNQIASRVVNYAGEGIVEVSDGPLTAKLVVDEATGAPKKSVMNAASPQGPMLTEVEFSDFRDIGGGLKFPFKSVVFQGGKQTNEQTVTEMKSNVGLSLEELSKKP